MGNFKPGDKAFIVESNRTVREVTVIRHSGGMYLIRFAEGGGIQVRGHRLFVSQEEAAASIQTTEAHQIRTPTLYIYKWSVWYIVAGSRNRILRYDFRNYHCNDTDVAV